MNSQNPSIIGGIIRSKATSNFNLALGLLESIADAAFELRQKMTEPNATRFDVTDALRSLDKLRTQLSASGPYIAITTVRTTPLLIKVLNLFDDLEDQYNTTTQLSANTANRKWCEQFVSLTALMAASVGTISPKLNANRLLSL